jgi:hypothetical protein
LISVADEVMSFKKYSFRIHCLYTKTMLTVDLPNLVNAYN